MTRLRLALSLAFVLPLPARAGPGEDLAIEVPRYGFRVVRPDDSWVSYAQTEATADADYALTLFQRESQGLPSLVIHVGRHDGQATAADVRAAGAATVEQQGGTVVELDEAFLGGRTAARLHARSRTEAGLDYEVELLYFVAEPFVYAVQSGWAAGGGRPAVLQPLLDSFALVTPVPDAAGMPADADAARLQSLADRCGSELPWAADWEAAAARAREKDRIVVVVFEHYAGLEVPRTLSSGVLMDPDVVALAQERCVVVRLDQDDPAPFRDATSWGMGASSWGGALLLVSPEGEVLEQVGLHSAFVADETLRRVLAARDGSVKPPSRKTPRDADERHDLAASCLRRGELERAATLLEQPATPRAHALRANLARRLRRSDDALAEIEAAREGADDALLADLAVEEAVVLVRLARWEDAEAALRRALDGHPEGARSAEASFWLGGLEMLRQGFPAGRDRWRALAASRPDDRWAWKAAANVLDGGAFVNGADRPHWPEAAVFAAAATPPSSPLTSAQTAQARRDAQAFLLRSQQADGSWISPMDAFSIATTGYTYAVTALCGSALLPDRDREQAVDLAVRRAVAYLLAVRDAGGLDGGSDLMGVYSIWSRAFVLRFLAQSRTAGLAEPAALDAAVAGLVESVVGSQHDRGGWPYVILAGDDDTGFDPSASFLTAGVLLALLDARAAGAQVPQGALDRGLGFLRRTRLPDGSFRYFGDVPQAEGDPEAAGRGPVCALALLRGGAGTVAELRIALEGFGAQREALARERGKDLCHTGPEGQGAHYLFYDWAFAAAAVAELPASERARHRRPLLQDVLEARDAEGAYADMPSLGRAYGTAMALAALRALQDGG